MIPHIGLSGFAVYGKVQIVLINIIEWRRLMEPREIEYEALESKYFSQLNPDDCIVDAAAAMAVSYRYRCDYVERKRILFTVLIVLANVIATVAVVGNMDYFGIVYFALLALWLFLMELGYRAKCKKPDRLQYFFLSKTRLFVNNRSGEHIVLYPLIKKINPIKYMGKDKKFAIIEVHYGLTALDMTKLRLCAGVEDAERMYKKLTEIHEEWGK